MPVLKSEQRAFWRHVLEARDKVARWPKWKQAAAGGVLDEERPALAREALRALVNGGVSDPFTRRDLLDLLAETRALAQGFIDAEQFHASRSWVRIRDVLRTEPDGIDAEWAIVKYVADALREGAGS